MTDLTDITFDEKIHTTEPKKKVPRKILHFSDGTLEEYSTDEEEPVTEDTTPPVDPKTLNWLPWTWFYAVLAGTKALAGADFCGEKLAWLFGITSPKYQYAIDEFHRLEKEDEEEKEREIRESQAAKERETREMMHMEGAISEQESHGVVNPSFLSTTDDTTSH